MWKGYAGDRRESTEFALPPDVLRALPAEVAGERFRRIELQRRIRGRRRTFESTGGGIGGGKIGERGWRRWLQPDDVFKFADRVVVFLLCEPYVAEIVMRLWISRIDPNRRLILARRFVELPCKRQRRPEIVVSHRRVRLQPQHRQEVANRV